MKFTGKHPCWSVISIKLQSNVIINTLWHGCSLVILLHICRIPFDRNTSGWLLLKKGIVYVETFQWLLLKWKMKMIKVFRSFYWKFFWIWCLRSLNLIKDAFEHILIKIIIINKIIPIVRNAAFFLKIFSVINEIGFISSKYFAMVEFCDANQSCKHFDEVKKAGIQRWFLYQVFLKCSQSLKNTRGRIQYLIKLLEGNNKTYWSLSRLSFQEICSDL